MLATRMQPFKFTSLMTEHWQGLLINVVNLLLVLWLGYQIIRLARIVLVVNEEQVVIDPDPVAVPAQTNRANRQLTSKLAEMHLFGIQVTEQSSLEPVAIETPDTRLKIVLHGTFASDNSRIAHAIIADTSGNVESYSIGDEIPGGIRIHEIHVEKIILSRNRRYETLHLLRDDVNDTVFPTRLASTNKISDSSDSSGLPTVKQLPRSLDDMVSPQPVRINGKFIGFRLMPLKDAALLDKMGLQKGDVVTWVNEVDLDNPMKGMQALRRISSGDYVNMAVRRDGQDMSLSFYMP